ncbi:MAG TPA: amino acid adenylation domain-containing protein, partial [Acidimicrobiia bacterium]|nr:amino acid adenylation domain-containing protein [Acidimicrobiia bacterium]
MPARVRVEDRTGRGAGGGGHIGESGLSKTGAQTGNIEALYPVTPVQAGMLYHTFLAEEPGMYILQFSCTVEGIVDEEAFRSAWASTVSRHQALRSLVVWEGRETPLLLVREHVTLPWVVEDLGDLPADQQQHVVDTYTARDRTEPFELDRAPLMRFALFLTGGGSARFVWTHHHVILDGWSLTIVLDEVLRDYALIRSGDHPPTVAAVSYQRFAEHLRDQDRERARLHWTTYLEGFDKPNLISDAVAGTSPWSSGQEQQEKSLSETETQQLYDFARSRELTLDTVLRAAWAIVVGRHSGDADVVFGSVVSGRSPDLDNSLEAVGPFLNTLPVRVNLDPRRTVAEILEELKEDRLRMSPFEWAPLSEIQGWSAVPAGIPLFTSLLVTENQPSPRHTGDLRLTEIEYSQPSNYPLALFAFPEESLRLILLHDPDRTNGDAAIEILAEFQRVLASIVAGPEQRVGEVDFFSDEDLQLILNGGQGAALGDVEETVVDAIRSAATREPGRLAVVGSGPSLTYGELMDRSRRLAEQLVAEGVQGETTVGISMERTAGMIVAILGVLISGGAYVPIDPRSPVDRIEALLADSRCRILITSDTGMATKTKDLTQITLDSGGVLSSPAPPWEGSPIPGAALDDLAYVMYTSGTTGRPKGVAVEHRSLAYSTAARRAAYEDDPSVFLLLSPFFFDSSVAGIFWTLSSGGTLVLPGPDEEQDVSRLGEIIVEHGVSHLLALPAVYRLLIETGGSETLAGLRMAIVAGESCPPDLVADHHSTIPGVRLINEYGPTETTVWCTFHETGPADATSLRVPIGGPIPGASTFILDSDFGISPIGAEGELMVAGDGLARGYLGRTDLTSESFVTVPIPTLGPTRLYRTGDRARFVIPGLIDLIGRIDRQVKIRGRRIEPGEIEHVLESHPAVTAAAVEVVAGDAGPSLAAFYVAGQAVPEGEIEGFLSSTLPSYLVPTHLVGLQSLPVTANGKVDRSRLRVPERPALPRDAVRPMSESEALVVDLTRQLVGHDQVGPDDNFFDVGGHSLLSMKLIARIFSHSGLRISPNVLLFKSLAHAATMIDRHQGRSPVPTAPTEARRSDRLIWFGDDDELFGILHRPADSTLAKDHVVVICPPYGWEYYKSHRALRGLARLLWSQFPVFRFDYRGTGDSKGDPSAYGLANWVDDVRTAVDQARILTGHEKVILIGLRLGASLAMLAADKPGTCDRLILWDP